MLLARFSPFGALLIVVIARMVVSSELDLCPVKLEPMGCYKERTGAKAMKEKIILKDWSLPALDNDKAKSLKRRGSFLATLICECAKAAFKLGYKTIGTQASGRCLSGPKAHLTFAKHGGTDSCVNGSGKRCSKRDTVCSGMAVTNFVYRIAPTDCTVLYEPAGCFKDKIDGLRPLPELLFTERSIEDRRSNGFLIEWQSWNTYAPKLICRCARRAKQLGRTIFGIQFYGECWSASDASSFAMDGESPRCLANDFKACPYNSYHCVGQDQANSVYRIMDQSQFHGNS